MKTSAIGRVVLTAREGCRLAAYLDSVGVPTIGVGHTGRASPPAIKLGMTITQAEADAYLQADLAPFEAAVDGAVKAALADHQFDALVSFAFNVGAPGFAGSTTVRKLNAGDAGGAADAMLLWQKPASLGSRRQAERKQFLTPYSVALPAARIGEPSIPAPPSTSSPDVALPPLKHIDNLPSRPQPGFWARFWASLTGKAD
ncbi:MAG TPA: lysozyme [Lichenihabitans sp.]|jgi:lysozyme|nr:lysozyme [Lichenihabitans sp.]